MALPHLACCFLFSVFCHHRRIRLFYGSLALIVTGSFANSAVADEHLFGWVLGAETLPKNHAEAYEFLTLRTGKPDGTYLGSDSETEIEYGFTDQLQASLSLENHYFYNKGVNGERDALDNTNALRFGGVALASKYRILSPFKDPVGVAVRLEAGYLAHDEVDGLKQTEGYLAPQLILQKNFLDDTLIFDVNGGMEFAWGKRPAEQYPRELSLTGGAGVSYRFAPNWFFGLESHIRSEYPMFHLGNFEHAVVFAGPSLHYGTQRWWVTLSYGCQVYGSGIDEPADGQTFAEEVSDEIRLKIGLNF
jgi:opacity protein-like surface antigen